MTRDEAKERLEREQMAVERMESAIKLLRGDREAEQRAFTRARALVHAAEVAEPERCPDQEEADATVQAILGAGGAS